MLNFPGLACLIIFQRLLGETFEFPCFRMVFELDIPSCVIEFLKPFAKTS